jgi:hypothetical protein
MLRIKNSLQKSDDWSQGKCQKGKDIRSNELVVKRDDGILMGMKMNECACITREEPMRHFIPLEYNSPSLARSAEGGTGYW